MVRRAIRATGASRRSMRPQSLRRDVERCHIKPIQITVEAGRCFLRAKAARAADAAERDLYLPSRQQHKSSRVNRTGNRPSDDFIAREEVQSVAVLLEEGAAPPVYLLAMRRQENDR